MISSTSPDRDARPLFQIGRRARLDLRFECRRGRTVLADAYAEPPLRVGRVHEVDDAASVILVCTGPGVFAGDRLDQHVIVGAGARVILQSQSALQVHPGLSEVEGPGADDQRGARGDRRVTFSSADSANSALIVTRYEVAAGGELYAHWDPVIPFAGSRLHQRIELQLAGDARLYWADGFMAGRGARGEQWAFASLDHELRLAVDGVLQYLERYRVAGERPTARWIAGDAQYIGTTIMCGGPMSADAVEGLHRRCAEVAGVAAAVDLPGPSLGVARFVSATGPSWAQARAIVEAHAMERARGAIAFRR